MASNKKKERKPQKLIVWIVSILVICMTALIFISSSSSTVEALNVENQPYLGQDNAPVQIVEFGDYKCPICKNFHEEFVPQIQRDYVENGQAKFYFVNYSFINVDSIRSAKFAEAVYKELGNDVFWEFHHLLFEKQPEDLKYERMDIFTEEFLEQTLKEIVTEEEAGKVVSAFYQKESEAAWNEDMKQANNLSITGTPTLYVNGQKFEGNNYEDLKEIVEEAIEGE
ncbi:DsbA family protein [Metabacillus halosaccharovorans]|uniref:DsbA family protein n=1 Tax=Metabacillus halosaccharovorans TaxID=930124 RepID=A0ABT3DIV6_9BACI|nr:DsbA family protein [Metabacillus halosaccharovorans]MCV9886985.1 DsbA family protein [Metabacillus halosaccharovorans]